MDRITNKHLEAIVARINRMTGSPDASYTKTADGQFRANIGNYHLSFAYGGVELCRMVSEGGGVSCPIGCGHVSKRALYDLMHAFIRGIETAKESQ